MPRLARVSIVLYALVLLAGCWSYILWLIHGDEQFTRVSVHQRLATLARSMGLQIEAMVADGLGGAAAGAANIRDARSPEAAQRVLASMLTGGSYVRGLFVVDESRFVVATREGEHYAAEGLALRKELLSFARDIWVGPMEPSGTTSVFPVARRIVRPDGNVEWAGAWISCRDLDEVHADLRQSGSFMSLLTRGSLVLRRFPPQSEGEMNIDIRDTPIQRQFQQTPSGSLRLVEGPQPESGQPFLFASFPVKGLPLTVVGNRSVQDAMSFARTRSDRTLLFTSLVTLLVLGLAVLLQVLLNRRWGDLQELADARRSELRAREELASELLLAQDAERKRLAAELHDGVGQTLSLLRNRVVMLRRSPLPAEAEPHAAALLDLATESIEDVRGVARSLRPMHLEELGVTSALRAMLDRVQDATDIDVHAHIEDVDDVFTGIAATHVYRIVQEAISNVLKHSGARGVWVSIIRDISEVQILVRDDGKGLPAQSGDPRKGLGLISIAERCRMLGAVLEIGPNDPQGTSLSIRVPVGSLEEAHA